jgi:NAD(P)-dependent dehydrogenase (short-subunit alcohol dehydrogenase family)
VDVLVANSGVAGPTAPLWEVTQEDWDETHAVNVRGPFLCCRAVLPGMVQRRSGSIVLIGSMSGKRPLANRTPYTSSKTALIGLVRTLAAETGPYGVRVNLISPGPVTGPRFDAVLEGQARVTGRSTEDLRTEFAAESPLRRLVDPEDVAAAVVYLGGDGSRSITGEDLNVNAGIAMY